MSDPTSVRIRLMTGPSLGIPAAVQAEMEANPGSGEPGTWVLEIDDPLPADFRVGFRNERC